MAEGEEKESWMFHDPLYGIISFQVVKAKIKLSFKLYDHMVQLKSGVSAGTLQTW